MQQFVIFPNISRGLIFFLVICTQLSFIVSVFIFLFYFPFPNSIFLIYYLILHIIDNFNFKFPFIQ